MNATEPVTCRVMMAIPALPIIALVGAVITIPSRLVVEMGPAMAVRTAQPVRKIAELVRAILVVKTRMQVVAMKPDPTVTPGIVKNAYVGWRITGIAVWTMNQDGTPIAYISLRPIARSSVIVLLAHQVQSVEMGPVSPVRTALIVHQIAAAHPARPAAVVHVKRAVRLTVRGTMTVVPMGAVGNVVIASVGAGNVSATAVTIA